MNPFRRSGVFGLAGVVVTAALIAVIASNTDPTDPDPKGTFALIFGILAVFIVLLFFFQSRDLAAAEAAEERVVPAGRTGIENPATLDEPSLWAALAIRPLDADSLRARKAIWGTTRQSIRLGMLICALIFLAVPPIYLLDTFVPLMVGAPLIAGIALWKSSRLLAGGGELDQAYESVDRAMAPLGLSVAERPEIRIEPKSVAPFRMGPGIHGAMALEGKRHGRAVSVRMPADEGIRSRSVVRVAIDAPAFEFRARDGRLKAEAEAAETVAAALTSVPNSTRWNGVRGSGGPEGVVVERTGGKSGDWLLDLWLAERLADAVRP